MMQMKAPRRLTYRRGAPAGPGGDQRRDDLYACKVRTEIQSVIDYFLQISVFLLTKY